MTSAAIRRIVEHTTTEQGIPAKVQDRGVIARLATVMAATTTATRQMPAAVADKEAA